MSDMKDWRRTTNKERKLDVNMTGDAATFAMTHVPCGNCMTRAQRREMKRVHRHDDWKCCHPAVERYQQNGLSYTSIRREHDPRKHNHPAQLSAYDHATGKNAWRADPSMTSAVRVRIFGIAEPVEV